MKRWIPIIFCVCCIFLINVSCSKSDTLEEKSDSLSSLLKENNASSSKLSFYTYRDGRLYVLDHDIYPILEDGKIVQLLHISLNEDGTVSDGGIAIEYGAYDGVLNEYYEADPNRSFAVITGRDGAYVYGEDGSIVKLDHAIWSDLDDIDWDIVADSKVRFTGVKE